MGGVTGGEAGAPGAAHGVAPGAGTAAGAVRGAAGDGKSLRRRLFPAGGLVGDEGERLPVPKAPVGRPTGA